MNRSLNREKFEIFIKIVYYLLRMGVVALYVVLTLFVLLSVIFPFIPIELLDFDLANLDNMNLQSGYILYDVRGIISSTGIVNVKWLLSILFIVLTVNLLFFQYIIVLLKKIITDVYNKKPFSSKNINCLKYMGIAYLVSSIVLPLVNSALFVKAANTFEIFEATINFSIDFQSLFMGTIILILAYVFDYGATLQEDIDLTV